MITVKEAVDLARRYSFDLVGSLGEPMLEEVEFDEQGGVWKITLGYFTNPFNTTFKEYKTFNIDADTGNLLSMKIRPVK